MKIKLDENLPSRLVAALSQLGHEVDTVARERLTGRSDAEIWQAAQNGGRFLVTQDMDFSDIRRFQPGTHRGLLLVRLREPGRNALLQRVRAAFQTEDAESWRGCFVVVTEHKLRVRRSTGKRVEEARTAYRPRRRVAA
jgi:predicted nuclease of predicted toxin-antitoxin system